MADTDSDAYSNIWSDGHKASQILMRVLGFLTLLASICPMVEAWADHRAGKGTSVSRVILSAMVGSISRCIAYLAGSLATPAMETENMIPWWLASGTITTCNLQGFLSVWGGLVLAAWDTVLSIFYVLTIRWNWTEDQLTRIECRFLHPVIWICATAFGLAAWVTSSYHSITDYCWLGTLPQSCDVDERNTDLPDCVRGHHSHVFTGIYFTVVFVAMFVAATSMILIYQSVLFQEQRNIRYSFEANSSSVRQKIDTMGSSRSNRLSVSSRSITREAHRKSREVAIQGMWYASTIIVSALPLSIVKIVFFITGLTQSILLQTSMHLCNIHGFFYLYTFLRRRTQLRTFYGRFVRWLLFDCIGSSFSRLWSTGKNVCSESCHCQRASDVDDVMDINDEGPRGNNNTKKPVADLEEPSLSHFGELVVNQGVFPGHESSTADLYASAGLSETSDGAVVDVETTDELDRKRGSLETLQAPPTQME